MENPSFIADYGNELVLLIKSILPLYGRFRKNDDLKMEKLSGRALRVGVSR